MESLKSEKFKSFEKHQVMKLNLVNGGQTGSTWTSPTAHGTDYIARTGDQSTSDIYYIIS